MPKIVFAQVFGDGPKRKKRTKKGKPKKRGGIKFSPSSRCVAAIELATPSLCSLITAASMLAQPPPRARIFAAEWSALSLLHIDAGFVRSFCSSGALRDNSKRKEKCTQHRTPKRVGGEKPARRACACITERTCLPACSVHSRACTVALCKITRGSSRGHSIWR